MTPLRLSSEEITRLLDRLDAEGFPSSTMKQAEPCFPYRRHVRVQLPGGVGGRISVTVPTRTISTEEFTFLNSGYVHNGVPCEAQLVTVFGSWINVTGVVARCDFVERNIHEVRLRFDKPIHPHMLAREACTIRALVVDDCPVTVMLSKAHLEALRVQVQTARDGDEAIAKTLESKYDLVLMDIEMPKVDGCQATIALRKAGYCGVIVALSSHSDEQTRARCMGAGCNLFLAKPYTRNDIAGLLNAVSEEPLYSTYSDDPLLGHAISEFVRELHLKGKTLEQAQLGSDATAFRDTIQWLRVNSTSFGFQCISDLAQRIQPTDDPGTMPGFRQEDSLRLIRLCLQARALPISA